MSRSTAGAWRRAVPVLAFPVVLGMAAWRAEPVSERPAHRVPARRVVEIRSFAFEPARLEVSPGDTVVWVNHDMVPHTATAAGAFETGSLAAGASGSVVAAGGGEVPYLCAFHPGMKGLLVVR